MRVAFTSSDGTAVDRHFGAAEAFAIWEVDADRAELVELVSLASFGEDAEDRIALRVEVLRGCTLVFTQQIGGPGAARLVARHIHPLKSPGTEAVTTLVARLQGVLAGNPPPWLARALGRRPSSRQGVVTPGDEDAVQNP